MLDASFKIWISKIQDFEKNWTFTNAIVVKANSFYI